jgi:hypothetical protein
MDASRSERIKCEDGNSRCLKQMRAEWTRKYGDCTWEAPELEDWE